MNIGKALSLCRTQKGMTKTQLSKAAGVSISYLTLLEQGKRDPNLSTINQICKAMSVPTSIFMFLASDAEDRDGISNELSEKLAHTALSLMEEDS
ncbi:MULTISPECIES: helix-turn-helix domain-containing protein [Vibrio harveyi group]|uniref:helix-turn-helix domain-containing protein n=1 Tax=Vibrio harveyi group TaxID=717610 RepID=UPI00111F6B21|nr:MULTISPECIES: helix-turn-helix transcriptional regulator [Vibrio harveyi group]MCR9965446.1 helix-turn-helix domain-containing protein [Vibrio antiquarius]TOK63683.1 transcriptional regulator [Vibrio parahaemolyticus]TOK79135.1 transcriptional regulator [Vibrio parahaemolyticus]TOK85897.1 transcriptional regulator [Vibrio parahaemolyticus]